MMLLLPMLLLGMIDVSVMSSDLESTSACRDYLRVMEYFPNGTSCEIDQLPTRDDLTMAGILTGTVDFLKEHCCAFGGGDRVFEYHPRFEQLYKFTGKPISDFQDQFSPSQKALFWLVYEDGYPNVFSNLDGYTHIGQRFALASLYFGLNGDSAWLECSGHVDSACSIPNKTVWMTDYLECEWAYLSCDRNSFVTEINMRK